MTLIKWNRYSPMWPSSFFDDEFWPENQTSTGSGLDVYEDDNNNVVVKALVPGVPEDKVEVSLEGNMISISAELEENDEQKEKKKVIHRSTMKRAFHYSTSIPNYADTTKASAEIEDGVVTITMPKLIDNEPKKLEVKRVKK